MENIDKTIKNGRIMGKPVIDNCTIYRLLDGIDKDTQRELCLKALSYSQGEDMEISNEGEKLRSNLSDLLIEDNLEKISNTIIELLLNKEYGRRNKNELLIIKKRLEYLDGNITLEEMQSFIHDVLLDDDYHLFQVEYQILLYRLLKMPPEEYTTDFIEYIKKQKMESIQKQLNPSCNYPN